MKPFKLAIEEIAKSSYSNVQTLWHSYLAGKYVDTNNIKGDVLELGIAAGSNFAALMWYHLEMDLMKKRKFYGLDSFEGIQRAGKNDTEQAGIGAITHDVNVDPEQLLVSTGITSHSVDQVRTNFLRWGVNPDTLNLVKGWVQHTIPSIKNEIKKIAILRLDMDVYDPTYYALMEFYPLVQTGGMVIIDDWNLEGCRKAFYDAFQDMGIEPPMLHVIDDESNPRFFFKP